ncbi:hypothetical protein LX69_02276 [Breznakibacter xylanolyticus]|uniref:HNH nuclease domain-containing protein n=1 Tax=Breznakibacter xylanolyticus TaxID=990 RepID=A0A2W7N4E9_9BACT|nr:HNH endonuclease signature motif containing protein [Breznakibacter xylanolyticus]PZX14948.1 hypothetical protein LX69_02276 [Breznakibacter xylanolyticus]
MNLHDFNISHSFLDSIGIKRLDEYEDNVFIGTKDFTEEEKKKNIEWRIDGVYLNVNGIWQKGYFINKDYKVQENRLPKYHLVECSTIQSFKANGKFDKYYNWSNTKCVTITERFSYPKIYYEDVVLELCANCKAKLKENGQSILKNTVDFYNSLDLVPKRKIEKPSENTDIFGRPFNWQKISTAYKKTVDYTCENCGFGGSDLENTYDKRFIDTDHIIGYQLTNTDTSNLQCLDKLCHYYKHINDGGEFNKRRMLIELKTFVNKYRHILEIKNTELLNRFDSENG